jgi:hypothetical protein
MEYFEITFYPAKAPANKNLTKKIKEQLKKSAIYTEETLIEFFDEENKEFDEICVSIPDCHFSQANFEDEISKLSKFVGSIFSEHFQLTLATGIYELSFDYYEPLKSTEEFNEQFLEKFPVVFLSKISNRKWELLGDIIYRAPLKTQISWFWLNFQNSASILLDLHQQAFVGFP